MELLTDEIVFVGEEAAWDLDGVELSQGGEPEFPPFLVVFVHYVAPVEGLDPQQPEPDLGFYGKWRGRAEWVEGARDLAEQADP